MTQPKTGPGAVTGSKLAKKHSAIILEVLSGLRTPTDAAAAMEVGVNRYYLLETRALQGLVNALEPRAKGRQKRPEDEVKALKKEIQKLRQENARATALLRSTQRTLGVTAPKKTAKTVTKTGKKRRKRKPSIRAMKAASILRSDTATESSPIGGANS